MTPGISVIVIGRNEGQRLVRCLESIVNANYPREQLDLIYVDTASTDSSRQQAQRLGARVVPIDPPRPTAALARNAGLEHAQHSLVHFFDGDTVIHPNWFTHATQALTEERIVCVFGRREELNPQASIYNFWAHHDWYTPPGRVEFCGGDCLFRQHVLEQVGGYDPSLIAGEERDLACRILRKDPNAIFLRLDVPMTGHDMNMTRFSQYQKRCFRSGYAYAEVSARYPELQSWRRTVRRNLAHATILLLVIVASLTMWSPWPVTAWLILMLVAITRNAVRYKPRVGSWTGAWLYAAHHYLAKFPTCAGHLDYYRAHRQGAPPRKLIEYRNADSKQPQTEPRP